jgi:outer membrane protein OmpA-like peptidoglycan-associated protein
LPEIDESAFMSVTAGPGSDTRRAAAIQPAAAADTSPAFGVLPAAALAVALAVAAVPAQAQDAALPSAQTVVAMLMPPAEAAPAPVPQRRTLTSIAISDVRFAPGSARLTAEARAVLDAVGRALTSESLAGYRFLIVGHTDASGGMIDNQRLSEARADAVRRYLIEAFAIAPARLESVGLGELELFDPDDPHHAANRRIEIANIGLH